MHTHKTLPTRFYTYLKERFQLFITIPALLLQYLFIVHYAIGSLGFENPIIWTMGFITFVGFFVCLRLFDEIKDKGHDDIHYMARPVQRGLISLYEIKNILGVIIAVMIILNILCHTSQSLWLFFSVLAYLSLMTVEFFVSASLRPKLILYMVVHQLFILLVVAYIMFLNGGVVRTSYDFLFLWLNLFVIMLVEVARKVRESESDKTGRDTYSAYLGRKGAIYLLVSVAILIEFIYSYLLEVNWYSLPFLVIVVITGIYYLRKDSVLSSKLVLASSVCFAAIIMISTLI